MPELIDYPPVRQVSDARLGKVLADIDSHLPAGHIYRDDDPITWGHETLHGIAAQIRMRHGGPGKNAFYLLENRAVVVDEPATTIREVAKRVPKSLRGKVYQLYLVDQARRILAASKRGGFQTYPIPKDDPFFEHYVHNPWGRAAEIYLGESDDHNSPYGNWNSRPLYLFDEWVAYAGGSEVRLDLGITSRSETVAYMLEFSVYALCVAFTAKPTDPQFISFMRWHLARARTIYYVSENLGQNPAADKYLATLRTSPDAEELRAFTRDYLGAVWTKSVLEF